MVMFRFLVGKLAPSLLSFQAWGSHPEQKPEEKRYALLCMWPGCRAEAVHGYVYGDSKSVLAKLSSSLRLLPSESHGAHLTFCLSTPPLRSSQEIAEQPLGEMISEVQVQGVTTWQTLVISTRTWQGFDGIASAGRSTQNLVNQRGDTFAIFLC